ncbi:MAG: hybrid sensor histidine kinase/response regulator [Planctomycetota bacterium]|jgi:signal transduction histidine kinase
MGDITLILENEHQGRERILIADDSRLIRTIIGKWVTSWGFEPVVVEDGSAAWEVLSAEDPPRIAILDWMMPGLDGVTVCRKLTELKDHPRVHTFLLTAKDKKEDLLTAFEHGACDFLTKPPDMDELHCHLNVAKRLVRAESSLRNYAAKLEELNEMKNHFLGIAAHDLRNPLSSIIGMSEILTGEDFGLSDVEREEFTQTIHTVANDMLTLVNDLLDVSVIESGELRIDREEACLQELIERRLQLQLPTAKHKNMSLTAELDNLPSFAFGADRIAQVIDNLVSNAIKYSEPGTAITLRLSAQGGRARFAVTDQGPGLSEEDQKLLFGNFQKLSAMPTGGERSTGLGLAIVKKIVEAHGGCMDVQSRLGEGSTFAFEIPVEESV